MGKPALLWVDPKLSIYSSPSAKAGTAATNMLSPDLSSHYTPATAGDKTIILQGGSIGHSGLALFGRNLQGAHAAFYPCYASGYRLTGTMGHFSPNGNLSNLDFSDRGQGHDWQPVGTGSTRTLVNVSGATRLQVDVPAGTYSGASLKIEGLEAGKYYRVRVYVDPGGNNMRYRLTTEGGGSVYWSPSPQGVPGWVEQVVYCTHPASTYFAGYVFSASHPATTFWCDSFEVVEMPPLAQSDGANFLPTDEPYGYSNSLWALVLRNLAADAKLYAIGTAPFEAFPYLAREPDEENITVEADNAISTALRYGGRSVGRMTKVMTIDFGEVPTEEIGMIRAFADECLARGNAFFFVPDTDARRCYFGTMDGKQFGTPQVVSGLHKVSPIKFVSNVRG